VAGSILGAHIVGGISLQFDLPGIVSRNPGRPGIKWDRPGWNHADRSFWYILHPGGNLFVLQRIAGIQ